jgi:hypothetical protein
VYEGRNESSYNSRHDPANISMRAWVHGRVSTITLYVERAKVVECSLV